MTGKPHFTYFGDYYVSDDYAQRWVEAAFTGLAIGFDNRDANFSLYGILGRLQDIKKGTVYIHVLMYMIHEMDSVDGNTAVLNTWDEGMVISHCSTAAWGTDRS